MGISSLFISPSAIGKKMADANKMFSSDKYHTEIGRNKLIQKSMKHLVEGYARLRNDKDNKNLFSYITQLEKTKGDYGRRSQAIFEQIKYKASYAKSVLQEHSAEHPELKNTTLQVYVDSWNILMNNRFVLLFQKAYEHANKVGFQNTTVSFLYSIYTSLAFFLEVASVHLTEYEFSVQASGEYLKEIELMMKRHAGFTTDVTYNIIALNAFISNLKNPSDFLNKIIVNEKSLEGHSFFDELEKTTEFDWSKLGDAIGLGSGDPNGAGLAKIAAPILIVAGVLLFIPALRFIVYFISNMKIDIGKYLEEESEYLRNNLLVLEERMAKTTNQKEKEKLAQTIEKQKAWQTKFESFSDKLLERETKSTYETHEIVELEDSTPEPSGSPEIIL